MSLCVTGLSSGKVAMLGGVWVLCGQYGMLGSPRLAGSSNELVLYLRVLSGSIHLMSLCYT